MQALETQGMMVLTHALVVAQGLQGSLEKKNDMESELRVACNIHQGDLKSGLLSGTWPDL